ncbi:hypothetical protein Y032_0519g2834 [Ancylostoma ceylanicum]|uniref:Uncharacterized protein n=1 Tax=Ancylostoma ceylanicum TaxID=53326 RepID=A0A016WT33_9BILA|nr:hypothetical protein Y032_0519g2834 [Ancylostoma ceylanicum]
MVSASKQRQRYLFTISLCSCGVWFVVAVFGLHPGYQAYTSSVICCYNANIFRRRVDILSYQKETPYSSCCYHCSPSLSHILLHPRNE